MRVIGLTGGIATGKSTVARLLAGYGAVIIDADTAARAVVEPGAPALAEIVERFGASVLGTDGRLDRAALAAIVFADADARRALEAITHPRIRERMAAAIADAVAAGAALIVVDIPLFFESGREVDFPEVMVVWVDEATQRVRLADRDGLDAGAVASRIGAQLPIDAKRDRATWVIDNSGSAAATRAAVAAWWREVVGSVPGLSD